MTTTQPQDWRPTAEASVATQQGAEFAELRSRQRRFAFPMTAVFLVWYTAFVLCAVFASAWMATPVWGAINIGIIFGLLQFVSTAVITWLDVRHASTQLDPRADSIRADLEKVQR